jgi:hypothetical protein
LTYLFAERPAVRMTSSAPVSRIKSLLPST